MSTILGGWEVKVSTSGMPEKVATAFSELDKLVGAEYEPIAYLGSQLVNGTNHAVLAKQRLILGRDVENIVLVIFHETNEGTVVSSIERVVESGGPLGGTTIDVQTDIPEENKVIFDEAFEGFVGSTVKPFALLGYQMVAGRLDIYAATVDPVVLNPTTSVAIVTVNEMTREITFKNILG